jgi:NADH:ubiquinone oxidoreductase subunit F (NADH-binding)
VRSIDELASRRRLSPAKSEGVSTFYDFLREPASVRTCNGTACWAAGARPTSAAAHCLGRCYEAPARSDQTSAKIPRLSLSNAPIVLDGVLNGRDLKTLYACPDPETIVRIVEASGLRGRGGAAFPTGRKWRVAAQTPAPHKYVVANGDEGDPGSYIDRLLIEEDPHGVLAGLNACAIAIGAQKGILFVRGEYRSSVPALERAIAEAERQHLLHAGLSIEVHVGAGSYVCGEESALLRAIQGLRAEAQPKPPYPAECGLYGCPTVVQNIETLAVIPWVLQNNRRPGTKAFCLSGAVNRPAVIEADQGIGLADLLTRGGGGAPAGTTWKMALVGGPMGRVVPASAFASVRLSHADLPGMGHGGIVVLDERISAGALAHHLYAFARDESCGNCAPCRVGTAMLAGMKDRARLERLLTTLEMGSLCGFGSGVPRPIRDLLAHFPEEMPC